MKDILPKGFSNFLKNPDISKLVCVVIAVFLAVLILRYFKVIEGMSDATSEMMGPMGKGHSDGHSDGRGAPHGGGGGRGKKDTSDTMKNMMNPTKLMSKIGMR